LTPHQKQPSETDIKALEALLLQAFSTRRKTISNTLKPLFSAEELIQLGIDPKRRPETLSVTEYIQLAKVMDSA
ncbi:MAG: rRNA adenine N-6-methyltransferase family protein, partial [Legionella sp.]|nr:rRNA adenine N-6-methyltransferase family protein [Legionella sp.]